MHKELQSYPYWTPHTNKRPLVKNGAFHQAYTYDQLPNGTINANIGILLAPEHQLTCIDVDMPEEAISSTKEKREQYMQFEGPIDLTDPVNWSSTTYREFLEQQTPLFSQLPPELITLINQSYVELSPSGLGLHIWLNTPDKAGTSTAYKKSLTFAGQWSLQNQFMTATGIALAGTETNSLATLHLQDLPEVFSFERQTREPSDTNNEPVTAPISLITPEQVSHAMRIIPPAPQQREKARWEELTSVRWESYHYWITIGMALHHWGEATGNTTVAMMAWMDWSKRDTAKFKDEQDVATHWDSFTANKSSNQSQITIATIMAYAARLQFQYPKPLRVKGQVYPHVPQINEYANFKYLIDYYNIKLYENDYYYLSGDKEIMDKYFLSTRHNTTLFNKYGPFTPQELASYMLVFCQGHDWPKMQSASQLTKTWCDQTTSQMDLFNEWLDTPFEELPEVFKKRWVLTNEESVEQYTEQSTVDHLFTCLNVRSDSREERALYYSLFKKAMFQIIKFHEPINRSSEFSDNGGILILSGAENTYKTTFLKLLLPHELSRTLFKEVMQKLDTEKNLRDFISQFPKKVIVVLNEIEGLMQLGGGSLFKNLCSSNQVAYVPIYQTAERFEYRKAALFGTTNSTNLKLTEEGTRRLWIVPVSTIDTKSAARVNLHHFYSALRKEFRQRVEHGELPWLLTKKEIELLDKLNENSTAETELSILLETFWPAKDTEMPVDYLDGINLVKYKGPKLMTELQVLKYIEFQGIKVKSALPAFRHALARHCGNWTNTLKEDRPRRMAIIRRGELCQNPRKNGKSFMYHKWVMPPLASEYTWTETEE